MSRLQVTLLIALVGCSFPALSATISFDEVAPGTTIDGKTIGGVLFGFTPSFPGEDAFVVDFIGATNFNGNSLFLPGEFSPADPTSTAAVLTLTFLNGPINMLGFQYAIEFPNANASLNAGTIYLYDSAGLLVVSSLLHAPFNTSSHTAEGAFNYSGRPVTRMVLQVSNLLDFDTTPAIDTITYQPVPEPGTVGLVSAAICAALALINCKRLLAGVRTTASRRR